MKIRETFIGILIIAFVMVIIVPPPIWLLDFILLMNIAIGLIILLNALYSKEPLDMSLFPTILLITTLFRLITNIATTRQILLEGYAGDVIDTFANFVAGGNMVVGAILFIIIVIVNFMVITKGSERVSEVTARFTLDAMPGKQMAIDADLNTGLITEEEAKHRRQKISDEAAFYGAMDGATKFVKGDAIASILITFVNLIGGIVIGTLGISGEKLPLAEAAEVYALMTIGDGLVGQIPALLISTATGLLVTKSTGESDISTAIIRQMFYHPVVMFIAGGTLTILGLFTSLPTFLFVPAGLALIFIGAQQNRRQKIAAIQTEITTDDDEIEAIRNPESITPLLSVDQIRLTFGYGLIPLAEASQGGDMVDRIVMIRRQIALDLGVVVPTIRVKDDIKLSPNEYRVLIKGVDVARGEILFDHYMALNPGYVEEEIDGIETEEPYYHIPALWINEGQRERAEALGYTVVDPPAIMTSHLTEVIREHLHEMLTRQDVQSLIDNIREQNSVLVDELIPKLLSVGDVQKVLANLLKEGVSIRDLVTILETLADYAPMMRDTDMLTEQVRIALRRTISKKYFGNDVNSVITLDPALEQMIMDSVEKNEQGSYLALDPIIAQQLFDKLRTEINKLTSMGMQPIVLASPIVRTYFKRLVEGVSPDLVVISYGEIDPSAEIQSVGLVSL